MGAVGWGGVSVLILYISRDSAEHFILLSRPAVCGVRLWRRSSGWEWAPMEERLNPSPCPGGGNECPACGNRLVGQEERACAGKGPTGRPPVVYLLMCVCVSPAKAKHGVSLRR